MCGFLTYSLVQKTSASTMSNDLGACDASPRPLQIFFPISTMVQNTLSGLYVDRSCVNK